MNAAKQTFLNVNAAEVRFRVVSGREIQLTAPPLGATSRHLLAYRHCRVVD